MTGGNSELCRGGFAFFLKRADFWFCFFMSGFRIETRLLCNKIAGKGIVAFSINNFSLGRLKKMNKMLYYSFKISPEQFTGFTRIWA